jgi:hypothetical protein
MERKQFSRDNHYVPQSYLKRWRSEDGRVWTYRVLVSNFNVPKWKAYSTKGIAYHSHLYTRIDAGGQTDEIEQWMDREYEGPSEPIIKKVIAESRMTPSDWKGLIKFLAVQDVRTPARLLESLKMQKKTMSDLIQNTLEKSVHELERTKKEGRDLRSKHMPHSELIPIRVSTIRDSKYKKAILKVQSVTGRGHWLFGIKHLLSKNKSIDALLGHKWTILKSPKSISWCTSDNPVIKLNYYKKDKYDFKGRWGSNGTEIMFPISPDHLLYTKIGERPPARGTVVSEGIAKMFQKIIVEHAHRFIYSAEKDPMVELIRPRMESKSIFDDEAKQWKRWHEMNVRAERDLYD